jgi:hypothetical protein
VGVAGAAFSEFETREEAEIVLEELPARTRRDDPYE